MEKSTVGIIVAGGRKFTDYEYIKSKLDWITSSIKDNNEITIISGGATGVDSLGERYAKENHFNLTIIPARWNADGDDAGIIRNKEMSEYASEFDRGILVAFWNGKSRGTKSMIDIAVDDHLIVITFPCLYGKGTGIPESEKSADINRSYFKGGEL